VDAGGGKLTLDSPNAKVIEGNISHVASLKSQGAGDLTVGHLPDNTPLVVAGHLHFTSQNFQVNGANQVATAPTDVFTWPVGTVLFDSTTGQFYLGSSGTFSLTEDLVRRLLQVALPEVKKGRPHPEVAGTAGNAGALGYVRRSGDPDLQVQAMR
jgi:hypothetical protein